MGTTAFDHTTTSSDAGPTDPESIFVPIGRTRAMTHALLRLAPALVLATLSGSMLARLSFARSGASWPIVDVAVALVLAPFALCAVVMGVSGLRWLALACWPRPTGIHADAAELTLALGPFGTRRYAANQLEIRYLFERGGDDEADTFEALLPREEQIRSFLPTVRHAAAREPLNRVVMRFVGGSECALALTLRPMLARWRGENDTAEPDA